MKISLERLLGPLYRFMAHVRLSIHALPWPGRGQVHLITVDEETSTPSPQLLELSLNLKSARSNARSAAVRVLEELDSDLADQPGVSLILRLVGDRGSLIEQIQSHVPVLGGVGFTDLKIVEVMIWCRYGIGYSQHLV